MIIDPAIAAAWGQRREPRRLAYRNRRPSRRRLSISPQALAWARREVLERGASVTSVARQLNVPRPTLNFALTRSEYGVGHYWSGAGHPSAKFPDEVVETIRWLATLPECPPVIQIARVFRMSRKTVYLYLNNMRRRIQG